MSHFKTLPLYTVNTDMLQMPGDFLLFSRDLAARRTRSVFKRYIPTFTGCSDCYWVIKTPHKDLGELSSLYCLDLQLNTSLLVLIQSLLDEKGKTFQLSLNVQIVLTEHTVFRPFKLH